MALYNNHYQYSFGVPGQMNQFQQQPVRFQLNQYSNHSRIIAVSCGYPAEVGAKSYLVAPGTSVFANGFRIREILYKIHRCIRYATATADI